MNRAFTLIEVMVYLSLLFLLTLVLGRIAFQLRDFSAFSSRVLNRSLREGLALDQMRRDLMMATSDAQFWDVGNGVFRQERIDVKRLFAGRPHLLYRRFGRRRVISKDIGFVVKKKGIYRLQGDYDYNRRRWNRCRSTLILHGYPMQRLEWKVELQGAHIIRVTLRNELFRNGLLRNEVSVRLRNGPV